MLAVINRFKIVFTLFCLIIFPSFCIGAEEELQYDEVTVYLTVQGIGGADARALIKDGVAYLSISDVFTLLKIKNNPSVRLDSLSGFFINPKDEYLIDRANNQIVFQKKKIVLNPDDLFLTETNLYMKVSLFGEIFGLNCVFSFRDLNVILTTKLELPLIREMKLEQMRTNLRRLKGEIKTDTTIGRSYPLFKFGMADWNISTTQQQGRTPVDQLNLSLGGVVAGGEMNVGLHYDQIYGVDPRQQSYLWRYVNNDFSALRQVSVGKIMPQSISTLNGALIGIQLTNTSSIYRRSFGTYTLSNVTEPGWQVELYVNNVLVDFVKADASGFYKFEVPLVYGNSIMMVKMYGPWGEVRTRIENANIPFSFLPPGDFEYAVNTGVVEYQPNTKFFRTNVNYGVSRQMSINGGYEYFSSPRVESSLPFIGSSVMLLNSLLIAGEYTLGVRVKSSLSYRLPNNLQLSLNYTGYDHGQKAILIAPHQERGISVAFPIQVRHFSSYTRFSLSQSIYSDYKTTNLEFLLSGKIYGVSSNITTSATYYDPKHVNAYSDLSLLFRLPYHFTIMPSVQYNFNQQQLRFIRCELQKPLFGKGYLSISYEHDFVGKYGSLNLGLRYDFSVMQVALNSILSKKSNAFSQMANGSLHFDKKNKYIGASNTNSVGSGGLIFVAFLDLNGNGKRDKGEPKILGLNLNVNGGRVVRSDRDSTMKVIDLTPYTSYLVEVDKNNMQNVSWKIKNLTLSVAADPNQFKTVEIPVEVMGEATGSVNVKTKNTTRGLGGIYVNFYSENQTLVGRTLTEEDGYYSYLGLQPGNYVARLDSIQLIEIKMTDAAISKIFTVARSKEGDLVEGLDFTLLSTVKESKDRVLIIKVSDTVASVGKADNIIIDTLKGGNREKGIPVLDKPVQRNYSILPGVRYSQSLPSTNKPDQRNDSILPGVPYSQSASSTSKPEQKNDSILSGVRYSQGASSTDKPALSTNRILNRTTQTTVVKGLHYAIQVGAYDVEKNAISIQQKIKVITDLSVNIVSVDGLYKIWIEGFTGKRQAGRFVKQLSNIGLQSYVMMVYR